MNIIRKAMIAATLAATTLVASSPAMARDGYRDGRGDNTAAIAIGAGIVGIALGAIIAGNKRDRYDDRYYVSDGWYYNDNYYYNRQGQRYSRNDWQRRYGYNNNRRGHRGDWNRGYRGNRGDWNRGNRGNRGDWNRGASRRGQGDRYYNRRGY